MVGLEEQLMTAIRLVAVYHDGCVDKIGLPYVLHPMAVAAMFEPDELEEQIVSVLHDILEDTCCDVQELLRQGINPRLCTAIEDITKRPGEELVTYYKRVRANPISLRVKLRDIEHNLSRRRQSCLPLRDQIRLKEKYRVALIELGERHER